MNIDKLEDFKQIEVVYGIHNTITDKWYIGSTFNLHDRIRRHRYYLLNNKHHSQKLQNSFNKYGINAFDVVIIEQLDKVDIDQLIEREIDYITQYDSVNNGYNMTKDCRIYKQFKLSKEAIHKVSTKNSKPIVQLDLDGNFIQEFRSISEAANCINEQTSNISKACKKGCSHSVKGFLFIYKKDYDPSKTYKYCKYIPKGEHLQKLINVSKNSKRTRKIYEIVNNSIVKTYNSVSELERELNLKKDCLRRYYNNTKDSTVFNVNNRTFKIEKSYSYKDIV